MSIGKIFTLVIVLALLSPLVTCVLDALCWFYANATCTGLVYDQYRVPVMFLTTGASVILFFIVFM
jgi:hypothetical protein